MTQAEAQIKGLKVVMLSQLLVEAMDDIKGTTLYKAKVKQHGNILANVLSKTLRQTDTIHAANEEMTVNLFNNVDDLMERIAKADMMEMTMINQIVEHYSNHKGDWENFFAVEMTKLDSNG